MEEQEGDELSQHVAAPDVEDLQSLDTLVKVRVADNLPGNEVQCLQIFVLSELTFSSHHIFRFTTLRLRLNFSTNQIA